MFEMQRMYNPFHAPSYACRKKKTLRKIHCILDGVLMTSLPFRKVSVKQGKFGYYVNFYTLLDCFWVTQLHNKRHKSRHALKLRTY